MRRVSVSGVAAFSEIIVFSTRPTVCLLKQDDVASQSGDFLHRTCKYDMLAPSFW